MNIDLTDREIELLMMCVGTNIETIKRRRDAAEPMNTDLIEELFELETDLREAVNRQDDGWGDPGDLVICDAEIKTGVDIDKHIAATQMFNAGVEAREKMKATSRACERRNFNLKGPDPKLSKTQTHDVWDANDPKNW